MIKILEGVNMTGLHPSFQRALPAIERVYTVNAYDFVITSAHGGIHSAMSVHYYGKAIDIRTNKPDGKQFDAQTRSRIVREIKAELGCCFDVVGEKDHIHIEVNY